MRNLASYSISNRSLTYYHCTVTLTLWSRISSVFNFPIPASMLRKKAMGGGGRIVYVIHCLGYTSYSNSISWGTEMGLGDSIRHVASDGRRISRLNKSRHTISTVTFQYLSAPAYHTTPQSCLNKKNASFIYLSLPSTFFSSLPSQTTPLYQSPFLLSSYS